MKKIVTGLLAFALVLCLLPSPCHAEEVQTSITVAGYGLFTLTNAEGQTVSTTTSMELVGNMPHSDPIWTPSVPSDCMFTVSQSESYVFETANNSIGRVYLGIWNLKGTVPEGQGGFSINGIGVRKITVTGSEVKLTGEKIKFTVTASHGDKKNWNTLSGKGTKEITIKSDGKGLTATGIFGTYSASEWNPVTDATVKQQKLTSSEPVPKTTVYTDTVPGAWYEKAVQYVELDGLMEGIGNGEFAPQRPLTRAQLAEVLHAKSWYRDPIIDMNNFTDVSAGSWYESAVIWADEAGIARGFGDGTFRPDQPVTREQMACMLYRYADSPKTNGTLNAFADRGEASGYAVTALRWAAENKIISGKGYGILDPKGNVTRAEAAQMLMQYAERIG